MAKPRMSIGRCCCGRKDCCCSICAGSAQCCLSITFADITNLDPSTNDPVCWNCADLNGVVKVGYHEDDCEWKGSYCASEEGSQYDVCGVDSVWASLVLDTTHKLRVELKDGLTAVATWEYDYGDTSPVDCLDDLEHTLDLVSSTIDCSLPSTIEVKPTSSCDILTEDAVNGDCLVCVPRELDQPWWGLNDGDNLTDNVPGYAPRIITLSFADAANDACPDCGDDPCGDEPADCPVLRSLPVPVLRVRLIRSARTVGSLIVRRKPTMKWPHISHV